MSKGQREGSVAQVGKDIYSTAVARCSQDLALWGCWLLVEAQAEQPWGGARLTASAWKIPPKRASKPSAECALPGVIIIGV